MHKYIPEIREVLNKEKEIKWRCKKCGQVLDKLNSEEQILKYLGRFLSDELKHCKHCRAINIFGLSGGKIVYHLKP